ncbi:hypothetical protein [Kitasatospora griseola]|uniref:hypothetical protein n=1 Tax=Kitasatospora griseola TaxID=2064 RepID=UPI0006982DEC|nr:hypothetical protein [Kitasatospora griseola]
MNATARKLICRTAAAVRVAVQIGFDTAATILNGQLNGLIRTGDMLDRLGIQLSDGQQSWYGRHVAKSYRNANGGQDAPKAWTRHRTTGRWIRVFVYQPADPALLAGLRTYKATNSLVSQADYAEAA